MRSFFNATVLCCLLSTASAGMLRAFSESGHHIIALMAFDLLSPEEQKEILTLLAQHPRFREDFTPPEYLKGEREVQRWRVGRAGYWPDVARSQPEYNRPTWHYELGATLVIGPVSEMRVPEAPGPLPVSATLETQELYIVQAIALSRQVMSRLTTKVGDRALACSWLAHLVADAHQPCHAGSLYEEKIFPNGDRGANDLRVAEGKNMHYLWDALLGDRFDAGDVRRRIHEISSDAELLALGNAAVQGAGGMDSRTWLAESRQAAVTFVYTPEVVAAVSAASRGITSQVEEFKLSEEYLKRAGRVAQRRSAQAAHRLAAVWREALTVRP